VVLGNDDHELPLVTRHCACNILRSCTNMSGLDLGRVLVLRMGPSPTWGRLATTRWGTVVALEPDTPVGLCARLPLINAFRWPLSASRTISDFMFAATRQPTMRRLKASTMKHTYAIPDRVGTYVRSVTHNGSAGPR